MMKKLLFSILLLMSFEAFAQNRQQHDEKEILLKVQQFFDALETQDTVLFKSTLMPEGQLWAIYEQDNAIKLNMAQFRDRVKSLINPGRIIQERMLSSEVNIHKNIAVAWVPYTLDISGKFSHCGIDIFTMIKTGEGWKIATAAYTMETEDCASLMKK